MKKKKNVFNIYEIIIIIIVTSLVCAITTGLIFSSNLSTKTGISYLNLVKDEYLKEFLDVYSGILSGYYEDVDPKVAIESAINGMTDYLGDKYTTYLTESEAEALNNSLKGTYEGYGISLKNDGDPIIYKIYDNTPASEAGLKENDLIVKINEVSVADLENSKVVEIIKNSKNLNIEVIRNNITLNFNLIPKTIILPQVSYKIIESNNHKIGYLYIETFSATIAMQVENALKYLESNNIDSLILDVRNNGGGYLTQASKIINMFVEKGKTIYSLESKDSKKTYYDETDRKTEYPILILQNGASASASEILIASLVDSYGAKTLGTITYGKGKVQQKLDLEDGSALKFTTSKWLRPNGECIDGIGISPDYFVELEYIKDENDEVISIIDRQIEAAINMLSN